MFEDRIRVLIRDSRIVFRRGLGRARSGFSVGSKKERVVSESGGRAYNRFVKSIRGLRTRASSKMKIAPKEASESLCSGVPVFRFQPDEVLFTRFSAGS